ncbi:MAG TPA: hypothetical protein VFP93_01420 [Gammaproteobacteria bacterium]|nr:hypothetical protein [Gammaproteobacteria bacterium]
MKDVQYLVFSAADYIFTCAMNDVTEILPVRDMLPTELNDEQILGYIKRKSGIFIPVVDVVYFYFKQNCKYPCNEIVLLDTSTRVVGCGAQQILAVSQAREWDALKSCIHPQRCNTSYRPMPIEKDTLNLALQ